MKTETFTIETFIAGLKAAPKNKFKLLNGTVIKIEVCISSKRIRQKEQTSTGIIIISHATNLHILK